MTLKLTTTWDKVFPPSPQVATQKVTFLNHFGIELAADLYLPRQRGKQLPALAVAGPFGAVKEQASGLYAQTMAERGFVTLAFDPSFTGESGGTVRDVFSLDLNTEDFQAAIDYLSNRPEVDAERLGIIGICGWGGIALNAAANDPRIKATVAATMYDMPRVGAQGYFDQLSAQDRYQVKQQVSQQRTIDYAQGTYAKAGGVVDPLPQDAPDFVKQYHAYYKTARGYHPRSVNSNAGWVLQANESWANTKLLVHPEDLRSAVLIVHGEKAHSRYMGEATFKKLTGNNKELMIVPGATHTDLYDGGNHNYIPFACLVDFFARYLDVTEAE